MTPEAKVKQKVVKQLKALGAYYFFPMASGWASSGVPDIVGCYEGRFFAIECKAGNNKPTPLQQKNIDTIAATKGKVCVINETNVEMVTTWLQGT